MRCPSCGGENEADARFCESCGASLRRTCGSCGAIAAANTRFCPQCGANLEGPPPPFAPPTGQAGHSVARGREAPQRTPNSPQRKGRGCFGWGCLVITAFLVLILVLGGVGAALYYKVPQRLGLTQSPAQRLLSSAPDREAAARIRDELAKRGVDTKGMSIYVIPIAGKPGSLAVASLDASRGFQFKNKGRDALLEYISGLAGTESAKAAAVQQIAIEYRDLKGESLLTLTAPAEVASGFASGKVSRQQFLQKLEGNANWPAFFQEVLK